MATTKIWAVKHHLKRVIDYATNPEKTNIDDFNYEDLKDVLDYTSNSDKTEKQLYVTGINCKPKTALSEMIKSKEAVEKTDSVLAFHAYQAFKPGEVDAPTAHKIGVELANKMWGDNFEVVVTTHLDKNHLHNHFVVNSISFTNGKRFINRHEDYRRFRNLSDAICKAHELSVIETYKSGKHYGEYHNEMMHKPTKRSLIINDVERAITHARTWRQFIHNLEAQDYEIKYGKHIAIRLKGTEKYFRLYKLKSDGSYSEENIKTRILESEYRFYDTIQEAKLPNKFHYKGDISKTKKYTGFKALYIRYMFLLGIIPKHAPRKKKVHFLLKEDLLKMDEFTKEVTFVFKHNINTMEELITQRQELSTKKDSLINERKNLYAKIKRTKNPENRNLLEIDKNAISSNLKKINEELKILDSIEVKIKHMQNNIKEVKRLEKENDEKDVNKNQERKNIINHSV